MRIHAVQTGVVAVKSRQANGGVGKGFARLINTMRDTQWTDWLPIYCWVIEHPEGLIVIDTGESSRTSDPGYFTRGHPYFRYALKMRVEPEQEIGPQLRRLGLSPNDARWVVMTHLHTDHAGGMAHFPHSEVLVSRKEHRLASGAAGKARGFLPQHWPSWFQPRLLDDVDGDFGPFSQGVAVTRAADVFIVPTPGHTPGHQSVILRDADATYLFAGDTSYQEFCIIDGVVDGVTTDLKAASRTIAKIQKFLGSEPVVYLPSHDPKSAERMVHKTPTRI